MKWTDIDLKEYREVVCGKGISSVCGDCQKTREEIAECYWELLGDLE